MLQIKLINSNTPTESKEFHLTLDKMINGECFIGRSRNCSIVLLSAEVSRVHGSICYEGGHYYFTDLASLSGSRINDEAVKVKQKYLLKKNDILRIGEFILTIQNTGENSEEVPKVKEPKVKEEVHEQPQTLTPAEAFSISILKDRQLSKESLRPPKEYMPVAFFPPEQIGRWSSGDLKVSCLRVIEETDDAKTFCFVADPPVQFSYKPGQFVTLKLEINGKPVKRSYSISSSPSRPHTLEITVKRVPPPPDVPDAPPGLVSNWLHDNIRVGSEIHLSGPVGKFTCFNNPNPKLLMISAGSGITPMMSMSRWIVDTASDCDVVFFHSARHPGDIIFRQELDLMSFRHPKFRLAIAITRPGPNQIWSGFTGRLNENMLCAIAPDFWQRTVYVCGSNGFMEGVKTMLDGIGFPMENYYQESFGAPKKSKNKKKPQPMPRTVAVPKNSPEPVLAGSSIHAVSPQSVKPITPTQPEQEISSSSSQVVFAKSGKTIACHGQDSILELAEQEGIDIESSCRSGACGTCKALKLQGKVNYDGDPDGLDESEEEEGYILTCIAYPVGQVKIDA